jgi:anti-sigma B factor antagonist/stage II sporulation protein AA (anti-sigma F factor antagonist)
MQPASCGIPGHVAIALAGDLDLAQTSASDVCLLLPRSARGAYVSVDLGAVTFLDSAGIGFLLKLRRRADDMGAVLDVSHVQPQPFETLRAVGLIEYLRVSATPPVRSARNQPL